MRPTIGVTGPDRGGLAAWLLTAWAIRRAGGRPRRIRPARPVSVDALQGLIIGGGADVGDPAELDYGVVVEPLTWRRRIGGVLIWLFRLLFRLRRGSSDDPARDQLEYQLVEGARAAGLPLLGICRGAQLINRAFGGTLHRDLSDFYVEKPNPRSVFPTKTVDIEPRSRLAQVLMTESCRVNSLHGQAVDRVGHTLRVVAREPNGLTQAFEGTSAEWVLGVQWHPEYLPQSPRQRRIFEALVRNAAQRVGAHDAVAAPAPEPLRTGSR